MDMIEVFTRQCWYRIFKTKTRAIYSFIIYNLAISERKEFQGRKTTYSKTKYLRNNFKLKFLPYKKIDKYLNNSLIAVKFMVYCFICVCFL